MFHRAAVHQFMLGAHTKKCSKALPSEQHSFIFWWNLQKQNQDWGNWNFRSNWRILLYIGTITGAHLLIGHILQVFCPLPQVFCPSPQIFCRSPHIFCHLHTSFCVSGVELGFNIQPHCWILFRLTEHVWGEVGAELGNQPCRGNLFCSRHVYLLDPRFFGERMSRI